MKKLLLTTSVLCMITAVNATNLGFNLLESAPESLQQRVKKIKESSEEGKVVFVSNKPTSNEASKSKKIVHNKDKKHQHKKINMRSSKHNASNYNQSYDVNEVFSQQQEQANRIMAKTNQINFAAQKVAKDASIQAQKTQDLLKAQKAAQASANATISSANELNKLSMSLQKNINSNSNIESSGSDLLNVESTGY